MKSSILIVFLLLFGLFYSCNEKPENRKAEFIESKLFGNVKSIETKTFENDTLKSRVFEFYGENGIIEKEETHFEPNLSSIIRLYEYDNSNRLIREQIITDGDSTFRYKYFYNNYGLKKKEEYYENKLNYITNYKTDSLGKIVEKNFKYENSDVLRTFKFNYPDSLTTVIKEFLRGNPDATTEIKIYPKENKKTIIKERYFPESIFGDIFYHNNEGNIIKKERLNGDKITKTENFTYELDLNKNWIKSKNGTIRKERKIEYYGK